MKCLAAGLFVLMMIAPAGGQAPQVGVVAFPNSGAAAAQIPFLRGLAQLHNFEYADAARAFAEARRIDPDFAMAYWGEAMTTNHPVWQEQDLSGARRVLGALAPTAEARLAKAPTARERDYLAAVETLFGAGDKFARDSAYLERMRLLHASYPDDVDAAAFFALALLGSAHEGRDVPVYMQAAAVLEEIFPRYPDHPGVAHYLIHAYDDAAHAPLGLRAARRYGAIAPSAPHALHMTSHIFLATGMWAEVVAANERATAVGVERARAMGRPAQACGHYAMWLMYGYVQQGRNPEARRILDACRLQASGPGGLTLRAAEEDPLDPDNIPAASYVQMWSRYLIDTGEWDGEVARRDLAPGDLAGARLTREFVLALAAAARHEGAAVLGEHLARVREARAALAASMAARRDGGHHYRQRAEIFELDVRALALAADGQVNEAVATLLRAAAIEDALPVEFGPPFVDKPTAELLGEVLLAAGRPAEAANWFRTALRRAPGRATPMRGLERAAAPR